MRVILALERSCLDADRALAEQRWDAMGAALAGQRALTEELAALFAAAPELSPQNDARVGGRVRGVLAFRDEQLRRLRNYNEDIGKRLRAGAKLRAMSRSLGRRDRTGNFYDTDR